MGQLREEGGAIPQSLSDLRRRPPPLPGLTAGSPEPATDWRHQNEACDQVRAWSWPCPSDGLHGEIWAAPHYTMDGGKSLHSSEPQRKPYILMQSTEQVSRGRTGRKSATEAAASGVSPGEEVPGGRPLVSPATFFGKELLTS